MTSRVYIDTIGADSLGPLHQAVCRRCGWTSTYRHQRDQAADDALDHKDRCKG